MRQKVFEGVAPAKSSAKTFRSWSLRVPDLQEEVLHAKQAQRTRESSHVSQTNPGLTIKDQSVSIDGKQILANVLS